MTYAIHNVKKVENYFYGFSVIMLFTFVFMKVLASIHNMNEEADKLDLASLQTEQREMPPVLETAEHIIAIWPTIKSVLTMAKFFTGPKGDAAIDRFIVFIEGKQ